MSRRVLVFLMFSLITLLTVVSQNTSIPNQPKEIRLLPENFKEDYQSDKYNYTESVSLLTKFKIWIVQKLKELFEVDNDSANETFKVLENIFYFIVIALAVYLLVKMILGKDGRWLFKLNKNEYNDPEFAIEEDIQSVNFEELIQKAVKEGDYRLAIKYQYFYLLRKLDASGVIKYDPQKTTYDYQLDLEGTQYNFIFSKAAYYYTYIWYGEFSIDAKEYQTTSNVFTQLLKPLKDE